MLSHARVVVRGACRGIQDLETGRIYDSPVLLPGPGKRQDGARTRIAPPEYAFDVMVAPGKSAYLKILR